MQVHIEWQVVGWPSGLRRWFKAPVISMAWVRIPPLPLFSFFVPFIVPILHRTGNPMFVYVFWSTPTAASTMSLPIRQLLDIIHHMLVSYSGTEIEVRKVMMTIYTHSAVLPLSPSFPPQLPSLPPYLPPSSPSLLPSLPPNLPPSLPFPPPSLPLSLHQCTLYHSCQCSSHAWHCSSSSRHAARTLQLSSLS